MVLHRPVELAALTGQVLFDIVSLKAREDIPPQNSANREFHSLFLP